MCCKGKGERGYFIWLNCARYLWFVCGGMYRLSEILGDEFGLLHGADVAGVPIDTATFGRAFIKYNTGGAMSWKEWERIRCLVDTWRCYARRL